MKPIKLPTMNPEQVASEIGDFIINTVKSVNATGCVLGLSGGVDSTTTAALTKKAFDEYNSRHHQKEFELVGYLLPSNTNNPADAKDGKKVAEQLGIRYETQNIEPIVNAYQQTNPEAIANKYDKGNLMARIRANILSTKAATEKKIVVGTGNKDEDFGIGYYTLFGDGAVHLSPIGGLPKRLVRQMATYLGFPELAKRTPTAGLEPGQTDEKDLGYNYDVVELVIEGLGQGFKLEELVNHPQIQQTVDPQLKQSKFSTTREVVRDVLDRHYGMAVPKAKIIHPPIAPITLNYEAEE